MHFREQKRVLTLILHADNTTPRDRPFVGTVRVSILLVLESFSDSPQDHVACQQVKFNHFSSNLYLACTNI